MCAEPSPLYRPPEPLLNLSVWEVRGGIARGLVLHLGVYFPPSRMTMAEIQSQVMKPTIAPREP
jgi:hypothetical protein